MKEKIKMIVVIGLGILVSSGVVYATTLYTANEVSYDNTSSGTSMVNVQGALDELYEKAQKNCPTGYICIRQYSIRYVLDGGTNASDAPTNYLESSSFLLPIPTKSGYTFGGWYEKSDFSGTAVTEITPTTAGDKTYYAKWLERLYLYKEGNEYSAVTGGWKQGAYNMGTGSITKNNDHLYIYTRSNGPGAHSRRSMTTTNKIDFSNYSKLIVRATTSWGGNREQVNVSVAGVKSNTITTQQPTYVFRTTLENGINTIPLAIDSANSQLYLDFEADSWTKDIAVSMNIYEVWLE